MFTAAVFYTPDLPHSIFSEIMALPYHVYVLATAGSSKRKTTSPAVSVDEQEVIMTKHFQKELDKLKKRVLGLGAQVEDRLRLAGKAIESREIFDVERIIKSDYLIDEEEVEIEE